MPPQRVVPQSPDERSNDYDSEELEDAEVHTPQKRATTKSSNNSSNGSSSSNNSTACVLCKSSKCDFSDGYSIKRVSQAKALKEFFKSYDGSLGQVCNQCRSQGEAFKKQSKQIKTTSTKKKTVKQVPATPPAPSPSSQAVTPPPTESASPPAVSTPTYTCRCCLSTVQHNRKYSYSSFNKIYAILFPESIDRTGDIVCESCYRKCRRYRNTIEKKKSSKKQKKGKEVAVQQQDEEEEEVEKQVQAKPVKKRKRKEEMSPGIDSYLIKKQKITHSEPSTSTSSSSSNGIMTRPIVGEEVLDLDDGQQGSQPTSQQSSSSQSHSQPEHVVVPEQHSTNGSSVIQQHPPQYQQHQQVLSDASLPSLGQLTDTSLDSIEESIITAFIEFRILNDKFDEQRYSVEAKINEMFYHIDRVIRISISATIRLSELKEALQQQVHRLFTDRKYGVKSVRRVERDYNNTEIQECLIAENVFRQYPIYPKERFIVYISQLKQ
jgi:ribosome-binding protein aMBF1 (putative translation factor)